MKFAKYKNKLFIIVHSKQDKYYLSSHKQFDSNFNKTQFPDFYNKLARRHPILIG